MKPASNHDVFLERWPLTANTQEDGTTRFPEGRIDEIALPISPSIRRKMIDPLCHPPDSFAAAAASAVPRVRHSNFPASTSCSTVWSSRNSARLVHEEQPEKKQACDPVQYHVRARAPVIVCPATAGPQLPFYIYHLVSCGVWPVQWPPTTKRLEHVLDLGLESNRPNRRFFADVTRSQLDLHTVASLCRINATVSRQEPGRAASHCTW